MSLESDSFIALWRDSNDFIPAHTSGSTGAPKPVSLLKRDMELSALSTIKFFGLNENSLVVLPLSPDYIAGKMMIVRALLSGARLIVEEPSRYPLKESLPGFVDLIPVVPEQIRGLLDSPCSIRNVIVGGGPVSPEIEQLALSKRPEINWWATYGMTETCSHVALRAFGENSFKALPDISFGLDARSCLMITNRTASWSPVITNDIVDLKSPSEFRWIGRFDNVFISGGLKVHPEKIERVLSPAVQPRNFYVYGRKSDRWGTECVLRIEGTFDADLERRIKALALHLSPHERPKSVEFTPRFRYTSSGKIKRD